MNNKLVNVIMFTTGAAMGASVAVLVLKRKYEEKTQHEIASVKAAYTNMMKASFGSDVLKPTAEDDCDEVYAPSAVLDEIKEELKKYKDTTEALGYVDYSGYSKNEEDDCDEDDDDLPDYEQPEDDESSVYCVREGAAERPYTISPDDFGEEDGFDTTTLTYFADGILADEMDNMIEAVDLLVGLDSLDKFGEYEDDAVYVRNEQYKCDYEILVDLRRWEDIVRPPKVKTRPEVPKKPHQMED